MCGGKYPGTGHYPLMVRQVIDVGPRVTAPCPLALRAPPNHHTTDVVVSTSCGAMSKSRSLFSSEGCSSCRWVERFLIWRRDLCLRRCGVTSTLTTGSTLPVRWFNTPLPISDQPMRVDFPHCAGRNISGRSIFYSPVWWRS